MTILIPIFTFCVGGTLGLLFGLMFGAGSANDAWLKGYLAAEGDETVPYEESPQAPYHIADASLPSPEITRGDIPNMPI